MTASTSRLEQLGQDYSPRQLDTHTWLAFNHSPNLTVDSLLDGSLVLVGDVGL